MPCGKQCATPSYGKANRIIVGQLSKFKFRCVHSEKGCPQVVTYADLDAHLSVCQVAKSLQSVCKNSWCKDKIEELKVQACEARARIDEQAQMMEQRVMSTQALKN